MAQISRPMQVLLAVTVLFAAVWMVALRPKSPSGSAAAPAAAQTTPAAPGVAGLGHAIAQAHGAVRAADGDAQRAAGTSADGSSTAVPAPSAHAAPSHAATHATRTAHARHAARTHRAPRSHRVASNGSVASVRAALRAHKALALAFVDPSTADSQAVARELLHVSHFGGRAFVLSIPLADISDYPFVTKHVEVTVAPTVVIVDRQRRATTIVGFADRGEIEQRLADALSVRARS